MHARIRKDDFALVAAVTTGTPHRRLMEAFWSYERALMDNDLDALDRLFAPGPDTLRGDAAGLLVGHDDISAFRGGRGERPRDASCETHVQEVDPDHALVVAVTELDQVVAASRPSSGPGATTAGRSTAAHVAVPAAAFDPRIWRLVGDPLLPGRRPDRSPARASRSRTCTPSPASGSAPEPRVARPGAGGDDAARAVQQLLDAGADVTGIARTDEFAYSLAGRQRAVRHPAQPEAPRRISGRLVLRLASAVSLGHASIGLGTDTAGSIRVPAAYQGLWGHPHHPRLVPTDGLLPLAPSFDTVGWLTRSPALLARVGEVLLPEGPGGSERLVVVPALLGRADPDVAAAVTGWLDGRTTTTEDHDLAQLPAWLTAFQTLQAWEAWQQHGPWLEGRLDTLGADVRSRFETGSQVTDEPAEDARAEVAAARSEIRELVGDLVLVLPSASSVAPRTGPGLAERLQQVRTATMQLTCLAGLGGLPAVSIPVETEEGLPAGVCLVAAPGRDRDLLALLR